MAKSVDIRTFTKTVEKVVMEELRRALSVLGEECVIRIKNRTFDDSWIDQTGNLRSSVGYGVVENGTIRLASAFKQDYFRCNPRKSQLNGAQKGEEYLNGKARETAQSPLALVVVAGMWYAVYVEAKQNKDVIGSTNLWAKSNLASRINGALTRATARLQQMVK